MSQRQKPRRTTELLDDPHSIGSTSKAPRVSRLAQPIRRSSSIINKRSHSTENVSIKSYVPMPTSCKRQRSISATPRTPKNNISQNAIVYNTIDKEKPPIYDKKWLQIESNRINDYLRIIENILGYDFSERGGIKSMSTKQFLIILQYFIKKLCGSRLVIGSNHVESIANILTKIQYPYTINKSWLKTPSAPHAFNNVVLLFNWFISFDKSSIHNNNNNSNLPHNDFEKTFIKSGQIFPNDDEYTLKFLKQTRDTFNLWNNGSEYQHLQDELINDLIFKRINLKNMDELEEDINRLNFEIDEIVSKNGINNEQAEYYQLDKDIKMKTKLINKLDLNCTDNDKELNKLQFEIDEQQNLIEEGEKRLVDIQNIILKQKLNITERNEFIKEVNQLNYELQTKEKYIIDLQDLSNKNQIIFSRLIRKKTDLISNLNTHIYAIFNEIEHLQNINIDEYSLVKDSNDQDVDKITNLLTQIQDEIKKNTDKYNYEIKEFENQLTILVHQQDTILNHKLDKIKNKLNGYEEEIKNINIKFINNKESFNNIINELNIKLNNLKLSNNKIIDEIKLKKSELNKLKNQNEIIWSKVEVKFEEIFEYRENKVKKLSYLVNDFDKIIEEIRLSLKDVLQ